MYRVWIAVHRPTGAESGSVHRAFVSVRSPAAGYELIEALCDLHAADPSAMTSAFGLEVLSVGGWKEWYDDGGLDVIERFGSPVEARRLVPA